MEGYKQNKIENKNRTKISGGHVIALLAGALAGYTVSNERVDRGGAAQISQSTYLGPGVNDESIEDDAQNTATSLDTDNNGYREAEQLMEERYAQALDKMIAEVNASFSSEWPTNTQRTKIRSAVYAYFNKIKELRGILSEDEDQSLEKGLALLAVGDARINPMATGLILQEIAATRASSTNLKAIKPQGH